MGRQVRTIARMGFKLKEVPESHKRLFQLDPVDQYIFLLETHEALSEDEETNRVPLRRMLLTLAIALPSPTVLFFLHARLSVLVLAGLPTLLSLALAFRTMKLQVTLRERREHLKSMCDKLLRYIKLHLATEETRTRMNPLRSTEIEHND
jgi:hypothetical protein